MNHPNCPTPASQSSLPVRIKEEFVSGRVKHYETSFRPSEGQVKDLLTDFSSLFMHTLPQLLPPHRQVVQQVVTNYLCTDWHAFLDWSAFQMLRPFHHLHITGMFVHLKSVSFIFPSIFLNEANWHHLFVCREAAPRARENFQNGYLGEREQSQPAARKKKKKKRKAALANPNSQDRSKNAERGG